MLRTAPPGSGVYGFGLLLGLGIIVFGGRVCTDGLGVIMFGGRVCTDGVGLSEFLCSSASALKYSNALPDSSSLSICAADFKSVR